MAAVTRPTYSWRSDHPHKDTIHCVLHAAEMYPHHSCQSAGRLLMDTKAARSEAAVGAAGDLRVAAD